MSMNALAWCGLFIIIGVILRAKLPFLKNNLVPASVIGGVLGFIAVNAGVVFNATTAEFSSIAGTLWSFSFANMGLTLASGAAAAKKNRSWEDRLADSQFSGICGMGFFWVIPYALTGLLGYAVLMLIGPSFGMDPLYGLQVPFAFAQGPGQSVTYGTMIEQNGWENAVQVGVTYASYGFLVAYLIGIPYIRKGIEKGLAPYAGTMKESMKSGLFEPGEQDWYGRQTTHSGNVDVLAFHFSLVGIAWVAGTVICKLFGMIPGFVGNMLSGFLYLYAMLVAYLMRWIIGKLHLDKYLDRGTQIRISGFCIDMMVVSAFMGISLQAIGNWMLPIFAVVVATTVFTYITCRFFGERFGGKYGFERTVAIWGTLCGTNATGQALCRMVDPERKTTVLEEMGPINAVNVPACYVVMPAIIAFSGHQISFGSLCLACVGTAAAFFAAMLITRTFGKKTYDYAKGELYWKEDGQA